MIDTHVMKGFDMTPRERPGNTARGHVQFTSVALARELGERGPSLGRVAKRDLARYYALLHETMPAISRRLALALVDALLATPLRPLTGAGGWQVLVGQIARTDGTARDEVAWRRVVLALPVERLALIDAAERAARVNPGERAARLSEFFALTEE